MGYICTDSSLELEVVGTNFKGGVQSSLSQRHPRNPDTPQHSMSTRASLGDVTNTNPVESSSAEPVKMRAHTRFDDDGNATTEYEPVEVKKPIVETEAETEEIEEPKAENNESEEPVEEAAEEEAEEQSEEQTDEKLAYRDVPSLFNDEKSRNAKWCGKHTRFPEDDEDTAEPAASSPEMIMEVDKLAEALPKAM